MLDAAGPTPSPAAPATQVPTPEPEINVTPDLYPVGSLEALICSYPWPCSEAIAVAACESGRNAAGFLDGNWASNGGSYGLFEINSVHSDRWGDFWTAWMDPVRNVAWAFEIWSEQGWAPWSCRPY